MNKRLTALALAAAITTGMGGFGTYAWFSDEAKVNDNVNITMGTLDVTSYWANDGIKSWTSTGKTTEVAKKENNTLSFTNVKPGDTFERDIIIANTGSLKADMNVTLNDRFPGVMISAKVVDQNIPAEKITAKAITAGQSFKINEMTPNGDWVRLRVTVAVRTDNGNDWQKTITAINSKEFIKVTADQLR